MLKTAIVTYEKKLNQLELEQKNEIRKLYGFPKTIKYYMNRLLYPKIYFLYKQNNIMLKYQKKRLVLINDVLDSGE